MRRVLAAVKPGHKGLPPAADHARVVAERFKAELTVMTAVFDPLVAMRVGAGDRRAAAALRGIVAAETRALEPLASSIRDWGVAAGTEVRWRQPFYEAVLDAVPDRRADLLVIDALEARPALHTRLTDADWQLMLRCPCPLLFVNDPAFASYETILAAVDPLHPGPAADAADQAVLFVAAAFARAFKADLCAVHACPNPEVYSWTTSVEVTPGVFYGTENVEPTHRRAVEALVAGFGIEQDHVDVRPGSPPDVIRSVAAERRAKLLVLGALERGVLEQAMLGSTAEAVISDAEFDVLLVKPRARGPAPAGGAFE